MFGLSFINCKNFENFNHELDDGMFNVIELSGQMINDAGKLPSHTLQQISRIHSRHLIESSISKTIIEHNEQLVKSFIAHFSDTIQINRPDVVSATFDFGIERSFANAQFRSKLITFIKRLAPAIIPAPFPILLPVRIPCHTKAQSIDYARLLCNLVVNNIALVLDIHPHELAGHDFSPEALLRPLRFDIGLVRFIYEPAIGNRLVEQVLEPWLNYLAIIEYHGDIIFCPASGDNEIFEHEYRYLTQLCTKLQRPS